MIGCLTVIFFYLAPPRKGSAGRTADCSHTETEDQIRYEFWTGVSLFKILKRIYQKIHETCFYRRMSYAYDDIIIHIVTRNVLMCFIIQSKGPPVPTNLLKLNSHSHFSIQLCITLSIDCNSMYLLHYYYYLYLSHLITLQEKKSGSKRY